MLQQHFPGATNHLGWKSGQFRDLDSVTLVGGARFNLAEKDDSIRCLFDRDTIILHQLQFRAKGGQFVIVGRKQSFRPSSRMQIFERGPGQGEAVIGSCAPPHFVEKNK